MKLRKPLYALLLTIYIRIVECKPTLANKIYNIRKFLQTRHAIWTYATTSGSQCLCQVDVTYYIDEREIFYSHYFLSQGQTKKRVSMKGRFVNKNVVYVRSHGSQNVVKHKIVYFDKQVNCAVVKVASMISPGGRFSRIVSF
ncbi:uncharacterized protein LOC119167973 isoform X1 [Rhipicephalus microplus]|uniref:uncharacterized protein LOC119167973 isoform X1 n=1 Tax=Rhipicephalus microplus TaxID=6941 RepID=UPI003F6C062D